jgi:hypothetical protein
MRRGFGFLWLAVTSVLLVLVGVVAYQAGWSEGAATHLADGAAPAVPYYYYGPHFIGFGFFGFLFFLFLLFVLFRIARFGRGWGYGGGGWGYRGWKGGYGGGQGGPGSGIPPAIDERMQEWHRRAHGEPTPTPPTDTKTV